MSSRKHVPDQTEHRVLDRSRRRCALCVHFDQDYERKEGQIAHVDRDPSNVAEDNLVYLCLPHHDDYDTKRRQTKNLTPGEVRVARDRLYDSIERNGDPASRSQRPTGIEADRRRLAEIQAAMRDVPDYFLKNPNFGGCSFSLHEIEAFRAMVERRNKPEHEFIDSELEELRWQFVTEGEILVRMIDKRLVRAAQNEWRCLPAEWRVSEPDRLARVAKSLDEQAAKSGLAYHTLIRAARRKLED